MSLKVSQVPVILLVEDEPVIAATTAEQLELEGYEVVAAREANQAKREFSKRTEGFHAVVIDVNLGPGPSGYDVARAVRERTLDLPIVFTTSDAAGPVVANQIGRAALIPKPYSFDDLLRALAKASGLPWTVSKEA